MKKNLISVLILALVLVNLVLTGILTITILPQTKKSNELITKVCGAIDLELESGDGRAEANIPMEQVTTYSVPDSMTINLKPNAEGKEAYAVLSVSISQNNKHDDFKTYGGEKMAEKETIIKDTIIAVVSQYTMEEFNADRQAVKDEILEELQAKFDSDFIIAVNFSDVTVQQEN